MEENSFSSSTPQKLGASNNKRVKMSSFNSINDFPESVLHNILSFLDMTEVVQTSVIAKRWRNLWKFQPVLYFSYSSWNKSDSEFMIYVDKALCIPEGDLNICKFYLDTDFYCKEVYVFRWMAELVRRRAEEICLKVGPGRFDMFSMPDQPHDERYELPDCLFTSPIRVFMLQVESNFPEFTYQLPKTMCSTPHLKRLQLASAMLPKGDPEGNLVLTCPVLERLEIVQCDFLDLNLLTISTPKLKYLLLENSSEEPETCKIKLITPNLTFFMCKGVFEDYIMENVSSLFCAYIFCSSFEEVHGKRDINLLRGICNATALTLVGWWMIDESSLISSSLLERLPHAFHNLKILKIAWLKISRIDLIVNLLKKSPYLETLHFEFLEHNSSNDWGEDLLSECSFDHLKSIEIDNYNDCEKDFMFLEFLMKHARVLENIRVVVKEKISGDDDFATLRNKLEALPKASSTANLQIVLVMPQPDMTSFSDLWKDLDYQHPMVTIRDGKICRRMENY